MSERHMNEAVMGECEITDLNVDKVGVGCDWITKRIEDKQKRRKQESSDVPSERGL